MERGDQLHIIDVRPPTEFGICQLPRSTSGCHPRVNDLMYLHDQDVPLNELLANPARYLPGDDKTETYVLCRLGNDSQIAADALRLCDRDSGSGGLVIQDLIGGLTAWAREVDASFPVY